MLFLILTVVSSIAIATVLRLAEERTADRFVVIGTGYVVATILSLLLAPPAVGEGIAPVGPTMLGLGILVGFGFIAGLLVAMPAIRLMGLAVPATTGRLSTLIPVGGSILLYGDQPTPPQIVGMIVGFAAFLVLGYAQSRNSDNETRLGAQALRLLAGIFVVNGTVDFSMKIAQASGASRGQFLTIVFATAGVVSLATAVIRRRRPLGRDIILGASLGVPNFFASYFVLLALGSLPAVVVFPVMNAAIVVGVTFVAMFLWREIPRPLTTVGLALAAVAVLLLGIG